LAERRHLGAGGRNGDWCHVITRLLVSNYRSLGEVDIELGPLTAFAGINGAGKSNVVDALRFVSECVRVGLEPALSARGGIAAVRRWSGGRPFD
jgi:predicted ATPase